MRRLVAGNSVFIHFFSPPIKYGKNRDYDTFTYLRFWSAFDRKVSQFLTS